MEDVEKTRHNTKNKTSDSGYIKVFLPTLEAGDDCEDDADDV